MYSLDSNGRSTLRTRFKSRNWGVRPESASLLLTPTVNRQNRHDNQSGSQAVIPSALNLYGLEVPLVLSVQPPSRACGAMN